MDKEKILAEYAEAGWAEVWRSWKDNMLAQGRGVKVELRSLPISNVDVELDKAIAKDVVADFLVWAEAHHGLILNSLSDEEDEKVFGRCPFCGEEGSLDEFTFYGLDQ